MAPQFHDLDRCRTAAWPLTDAKLVAADTDPAGWTRPVPKAAAGTGTGAGARVGACSDDVFTHAATTLVTYTPASAWPQPEQALTDALLTAATWRSPPQRRRRPAPLVYALWRDVQHVFDARHIARFFAEDRYVCFHHNGREFMVRGSLQRLQSRLRAYGFLLVHRAQLINLRQVASLRRRAGRLHAILQDGQEVPVARRLASQLQAQLAQGQTATA